MSCTSCDEPAASVVVKLRKLLWTSHVERKDEKQIPNGVFKSTSEGRRPVGSYANGGGTQWRRPVKSC